jgi:hypothetical protein
MANDMRRFGENEEIGSVLQNTGLQLSGSE